MRKYLFCLVIGYLLFISVNCNAETVKLSDEYFGDRSMISGTVFSNGGKIAVKINVGTGMAGWVLTFYTADKAEPDKIKNITKFISQYINKNNDIDPIKMLTEAGLTNVTEKK